jgi:hypothetical protein
MQAHRVFAEAASIEKEAVFAVAAPLALEEALLDGGGEVELDEEGLGGNFCCRRLLGRGGLGRDGSGLWYRYWA